MHYQKDHFIEANAINCGYFVLSRDLLEFIEFDNSLEDSLLSIDTFIKEAYVNVGRNKYYTVGDPSRRAMAEVFFSARKTVLFDRDGTLLKGLGSAEFYSDFSEGYFKVGAISLLKKLSEANLQIGIVTNQPAVGNGQLSYQKMLEINWKILTALSRNGVKLNAFSICKHGWNEGCFCRKPLPGLMYEVQHLLDLNWASTLYIGDMERDERMAQEVGCEFIRVNSTENEIDIQLFDTIMSNFK